MQYIQILLLLVGLVSPLVLASFDKDVIRSQRRLGASSVALNPLSNPDLNAELLDRAIPLSEYEKRVGRQLNQQQYDFEVDYDNMYSFSGFSLKYAKCQPVQYFSEDAIVAGEHSPMVREDIVILRLCPQSSCSSTLSYGCYYNYADYALTLGEYVGVMLRYSARVRENTCEWCDQCLVNERKRQRRLEDNGNNAEADGEDEAAADAQVEGDDAVAAAAADDEAAVAADDAVAAVDDAAAAPVDDAAAAETDDFDPSDYACDGYNEYCSNYEALCGDGNDDSYIDYENFVNYMDCKEVKYNDYAYFVRPQCDADSGAIKMAVYHDNYCIQYAGTEINIKNFGLGFKDGMFNEFYSSTCIECSDTDGEPPYFGSNNVLCNLIHGMSATCTKDMLYDLFENEQDETSECSFIESIQFGVYDKYGYFSATSANGSNGSGEVSQGQLIALVVSLSFCVIFIIYACYLHHTMTNILIKSLSHRELLPPSRHKVMRTYPTAKASSCRRSFNDKKKQADEESEWDSAQNGDFT